MVFSRIRKSTNSKYYFFLLVLYLSNLKDIIFPKYFQQDDLAELRVTYVTNFFCALNQGDNHPLFTYVIWVINKLFGFDTPYIVSFLNVCLGFGSIILIFKIFSNFLNIYSGFFIGCLILSSKSFLTYSVSLKQYPIEVFTISLLLYLISFEKLTLNYFAKNKKYIVFLILLSGFSLIIPIFLLIAILFEFIKNHKKKFNTVNILAMLLPILIFSNQIIDKITRESYEQYWKNYFVSTDSFSEFLESFKFLTSLVFKNVFSALYHDYFYYAFILLLLAPLLLKKPKYISFSYFVLIIFIFLNVFRLYPLGGGRTEIVLIPFFTSILSFSIYSIFKNKKIQILITFVMVFLSFVNTSAFYKVENLRSPIIEIGNDFKNTNVLNIIMYDQRHSFDYEAKKIFGTKAEIINGCNYLSPNINNYFITGKNTEMSMSEITTIISNQTIQKINLIGIELIGTMGEFRMFEKELNLLNYKIKDSIIYEKGIYLVKLER